MSFCSVKPTLRRCARCLRRVRVAAFPTHYAVPVASGTVMEAIAAGAPIVGSSEISRDVLVDGVNGIVTDTKSDVMAAALNAVLNDDGLWLRFSGARVEWQAPSTPFGSRGDTSNSPPRTARVKLEVRQAAIVRPKGRRRTAYGLCLPESVVDARRPPRAERVAIFLSHR